MPKQFFCSYCGLPLTYSRKALKNKGMIMNLIDPHECDESHMENIVDADKPTRKAVTPVDFTEVASEEKKALINPNNAFDLGPGDKRDKKDLHPSFTSSAPSSTREMIKDSDGTSEPEGNLEDP